MRSAGVAIFKGYLEAFVANTRGRDEASRSTGVAISKGCLEVCAESFECTDPTCDVLRIFLWCVIHNLVRYWDGLLCS